MKGKFIVIEGLDRAGKTTLIDNLKKDLEKHNIVFTREPGGLEDNTAEAIRNILKDSNNEIDPTTEAILFAASRRRHGLRIKELLNRGISVISDRYIYSSIVYQGCLKKIGLDKVLDINKYSEIIEPDLALFLTINDVNTYIKRGGEEPTDRLEKKVKQHFNYMKTSYKTHMPNGTIIINGEKDALIVKNEALKYIKKIITE